VCKTRSRNFTTGKKVDVVELVEVSKLGKGRCVRLVGSLVTFSAGSAFSSMLVTQEMGKAKSRGT